MWIVRSNVIQENREGINCEQLRNGELSHHDGEGYQGRANDTRPDIGQNKRKESSPPAASQAVCRLSQYRSINCSQAIVDWAVDEWQRDNYIGAYQQRRCIDNVEVV